MKQFNILEDGDIEYNFQCFFHLENELIDYQFSNGSGVYTPEDWLEWDQCISANDVNSIQSLTTSTEILYVDTITGEILFRDNLNTTF